MAGTGLTQQEAQRLFKVSSFLLLQDIPVNTQISIDAYPQAYLTNDQFQGIKLLPPGWHCISWNVREPLHSDEEAAQLAFGGQESVKHVLLRWFDQGEVAVRSLDRANEELVIPGPSRSINRRSQRKINPKDSQSTATIVSRELLESLDARLLPYPHQGQAKWQRATRNLSQGSGRLGRAVVAKIIGLGADSGDATLDSLTAGPETVGKDHQDGPSLSLDGNLGRAEQGKRIWGKSRPDQVPRFEQVSDEEEDTERGESTQKRKRIEETTVTEEDDDDGLLHFTTINLRRSWPADSLGPDITRWSRDKSWLLRHTINASRIGVADLDETDLPIHCALLCELELAFILFAQSGNACCWEQWKCIVTLFCRSSSYLGAGSEWQPHPSVDGIEEQEISGNAEAHAAFLQVLVAQMHLLEDDFWSTQSTPSDERNLISDLDSLRANIGRSLARSAAIVRSNPASQATTDSVVNDLIGAWRSFSHLTLTKFGWQLDRRLDEEAEVEQDLEAEEGDDAPIIVEM